MTTYRSSSQLCMLLFGLAISVNITVAEQEDRSEATRLLERVLVATPDEKVGLLPRLNDALRSAAPAERLTIISRLQGALDAEKVPVIKGEYVGIVLRFSDAPAGRKMVDRLIDNADRYALPHLLQWVIDATETQQKELDALTERGLGRLEEVISTALPGNSCGWIVAAEVSLKSPPFNAAKVSKAVIEAVKSPILAPAGYDFLDVSSAWSVLAARFDHAPEEAEKLILAALEKGDIQQAKITLWHVGTRRCGTTEFRAKTATLAVKQYPELRPFLQRVATHEVWGDTAGISVKEIVALHSAMLAEWYAKLGKTPVPVKDKK